MSSLQDDFDSFLRETESKESQKVRQNEQNMKQRSVRARVDSALHDQEKVINANANNAGQQYTQVVTTKTAPTHSDSTNTSLMHPTMLQDRQVIPPNAWNSGQPQVALPVMSSSVAHIPRNVMGDAAWPPVRPPSSGPAVAETRFQIDQGAASMAALAAWRTPSQPVRDEDVAAAFAELMQMAAPQSSKIQVSTTLTPPLCLEPPPHVPPSIDLELLRDPEVEVRDLPCEPVPLLPRATARYYSNSEANKRGALSEQPRTRQVRERAQAECKSERSSANDAKARMPETLSPLAQPPANSEPIIPPVVERPDDNSTDLVGPVPGCQGTISARPALADASACDTTVGCNNPADLRILQGPSSRAQAPEGGGGGDDPRGDRGPGVLDDLMRSTKSAGVDRRLQPPIPPRSLSTVGDRSGESNSEGPPARQELYAARVSDHGASTESGASTAAVAPAPSDRTLPHAELTGATRSRLLTTLAGFQYLPKGSRVGQCKRWTTRVGVSLDGAGSLSVRVLEDVTWTLREPHTLPGSSQLVGHAWNISVERIPSEVEQGEDAMEGADEPVLRILNRIGEQMDDIRDRAVVHDAGSMRSVLSSLLNLLDQGQRKGPADLRVLQDPLPLGGRGEGNLCRDCGPGISDESEQLTDEARHQRLLASPRALSTVGYRSGESNSAAPPARLGLEADRVSHGADTVRIRGNRVTAASSLDPSELPLSLAENKQMARSRLLTTLAGSQHLPKGSRVGKFRRWTARVGVSLDGAGSMSVRVLESVTSAPREPHTLPYSGDLVGHVWNISVERIPAGDAQGEAAEAAADARVLGVLDSIGEQMDDIRDEAEVYSAGGMQSVLLRLLRLLTGVARNSGCGCDDSADLRILQDFPPLAPPEGGGRVEPRVTQVTEISDDLPQPAPWRSGASPSDNPRAVITLRDYMPGECTPGPQPRARGAGPTDPIAWRASVLACDRARQSPRPPPQQPRLALTAQQQPHCQPTGKQRQQRTQPPGPESVGAHCRLPSQPIRQPATSLPEEHPRQSGSPRLRASPPMSAPIQFSNFYGPLAVEAEDTLDQTVQQGRRHRPERTGRQFPSETRARQEKRQALRSQASTRAGQSPGQRGAANTANRTGTGPESGGTKEPQTTARPFPSVTDRAGVLSTRQEFSEQLPSAADTSGSRILPGRRMGGWSLPRPHSRSTATALHAISEDGPLSFRIPAEEFQCVDGSALPTGEQVDPFHLRVVHGGRGPRDDIGGRGGTTHRSVLWGKPPAQKRDSEAGPARRQTSSAERPSAVRHTPPMAMPEEGGGFNARGGQGSGRASLCRIRSALSSTSSPPAAQADLYPARVRGTVVSPPRLGTVSTRQQVPLVHEPRAVVWRGERGYTLPVTRDDWDGFDHFRHGPSPDLVMALCLRQHLGCSELVNIELVSHDVLILHRGDWPASWEEFCSFVAGGGSFRVGALLRGGMDPARKALLDAVHFATDTDWPLLDRCLEAVRQQAQQPAEATPEQRTIAELMSEATPLRQWALMETVPGIQGRCNATPARMTALGLLLARPRVRVRLFPPCVAAGQAGQHVELRFNSIPPPSGPASGGVTSMESIKDWVLSKLEELAPEMWVDPAFALRTVRKSMRLEGNLAALQTFSLTVLLPFGDWITAFLKGERTLGPGGYATVAPVDTHTEVELTPLDHAVFRAIRLSLGLNHADSLELLEDGLRRALRGTPVACRFTTSRRIVGGGGGGGAKGKPSYVHHSPDDEGASTLFTIEAADLVVARRKGLHISFSLGDGDEQRPLALKIQLPVCPPGALYRMVESRVTPPLRTRDAGTLFQHSNVLIGPLPANWMTDKIVHSSSEEERLRRASSLLWKGCVQAEDIHFVGKRDKGDRNPMFLYIEFPGLEEARTFGANLDRKSFQPALAAFWSRWMGDRPVHLWSCALLTEALEVVPFKNWKGLMELGMQSPCPLPDPVANAGSA